VSFFFLHSDVGFFPALNPTLHPSSPPLDTSFRVVSSFPFIKKKILWIFFSFVKEVEKKGRVKRQKKKNDMK
jgi:hypothetical protein